MKKPITISFLIAFLVSFSTAIIVALPGGIFIKDTLTEKFFIVILIVFFISFFISWMVIEKLIFKKIKSIHFYIKNLRKAINKETITSVSVAPIDDLSKEVYDWSNERKEEIEQLKRMESYRKEFLGNVSHELKTPIFNIQGYILTLLDGGLEDAKINRNYLIRAEKSVDRLISIVEDLQAISQLEARELELEMERFDIVQLAKEIADAQEMAAKNKHITISVSGNDEKPVFVLADRSRIRQVLTNLVVNSVKYGKEQGETRIKISDVGENVLIEVSDNGIGIAKEHLPRIFERFYRVDKSRSREQGGTGLGLSIVKHIMEAHHTTINVMSAEGAGSVFSFALKKN